VAVACAPGVPLLLTLFHNNQANGLGFGGHAAAGAAGGLSPYGIFNNVVWALWGYHSNGVIAGAVAVWPLGILGVLLLLGRGRHPAHTLLATVAFLPLLAVFVASAEAAPNRSLFEVRYFIEAVPALYLLVAGMVWTMAPTVRIRRVVGAVVAVSFVVGLVTQQTDGDNPRLYGYDAAFAALSARARPGDEILYAPAYVNVDVGYFEPGMRAAPVGTTPPSLPGSARIFVVAMTNFAGADVAAETGSLLSRLERTRRLELVLRAPNVELWELS
jgi:hypothetical protein